MQIVEIRIKGRIDEHWSDWFAGLKMTHPEHDQTILTGEVTDQSALCGLLAKLRDLDLQLVSVRHLGPDPQQSSS
ncbi:MAG: hypothetical protein PVJ55_06410 [Anaerolineae bacterium]